MSRVFNEAASSNASTAEPEVETPGRGAPGAGNLILHHLRLIGPASDVEFERGIEKTGFWGQSEY